MRWVFRIAVSVFAFCAAAFAIASIGSRAEARSFDSAPLCTASRDLSTCRRVEPAVIIRAPTVSGGKSRSTQLTLRVSAPFSDPALSGPPSSSTYTTTIHGDVSAAFTSGQPVTVTLWGSVIAQVTDTKGSWGTEDGPDYNASSDAGGVVSMLGLCLFMVRFAAWTKRADSISRNRMLQVDTVLAALFVAVCVLAATHAAVAMSCTTAVALAALGAATFWPRHALRRQAVRAERTAKAPVSL